MEPKQRRVFDKEFKKRTVELIIQGGKKVKEVAMDLGLESNDVYRWVREYNRDPQDLFPGKGKLKPEDEELRQLKRQLIDVTEERDILKKAVGIFSKVKRCDTDSSIKETLPIWKPENPCGTNIERGKGQQETDSETNEG